MDWARRTSTVQHDGLPPLPSMPKEEKLACQCLVAGECLCSAAGKTVKRCANNILTKVVEKTSCPALTRNRVLLMEGRIAIAFQSPAFDFGPSYVMAQADPPDFLRPSPGQLWFHIGLHYLRPYRPTIHALSRSKAASR